MDPKRLIEYLFMSLLSGCGGLVVTHISTMSDNLQKITLSIQELNGRIETLTERMVTADHTLKDHENRIRRVELK